MKKLKEPFFIVPSKIFSLGLSPYELAIVFYLCMRADNEKHTCWPSEKLMARECGMSLRTIRNVLRRLEKANIISKESHYEMSHNGLMRQPSNHYCINLFEDYHEEKDNQPPKVRDSSPEGIVCPHPRQEMPPPEAPRAGEINKTISNKTKTNITKSIELRPADTRIERENIKVFEELKEECLRVLTTEWNVSGEYRDMLDKALINIWNRQGFMHDGRTYSGDEVCTILCRQLTASALKSALDSMLERGEEVRMPMLYLAKCIFAYLVSPTPEKKKKESGGSSSFDLDDFFEAALRRSDELLSKYDPANVGKG